MKAFRIIIVLLITLLYATWSSGQNDCGVDIELKMNPNNNCQYDLTISVNENCGVYNFTQFTINSASNFMNPSEIKSVEDLYGGLNIERPTSALAIFTNSGFTGNFIFEAGVTYSIARFEFENGGNISEVGYSISGTNPEGQAESFGGMTDVDANCVVQNICSCMLRLEANPNASCCYSIIAGYVGSQCDSLGMGDIQINTLNGGSATSSMLNVTNNFGTTHALTGSASMLSISAPASGWGFALRPQGAVVGEVCFENGTAAENVNLSWSGTTAAAVPMSCQNTATVDASCGPPPPDCICFLDYREVDDCCYEVGVEFRGADCPNLNFTGVNVNSNIRPTRGCEIYQATSTTPGITPVVISNTEITFRSGTNLGNVTNVRQVIGEVCFNNAVDPLISNARLRVIDNLGSGIGCEETIEAQTCKEPKVSDKLMGDSLSNIPVKVIPVGYNKMQVLANTVENGVQFGVMVQYDLSTGRIDWFHKSDPNYYYSDVAYHPGVRQSYIVGHRPQQSATDDNESIITIIDKFNGQCIDVVTYQQTGREQFRKILYNPSVNPGLPNHDLYIVGAKNVNTAVTQRDLLFVMNLQTNLTPNWYTEIYHTGDDEFYRGIIPSNDGRGVYIVGNDSNNNRGVWARVTDTGNYIESRILDNRIDLYDGHEFGDDRKLLIGTDFNGKRGLLTMWDRSNNIIDGLRFPTLKEFKELTYDGTHFYTVAQKVLAPNDNVIVKFHIEPSGQITVDNAYETQNSETNFSLATINWHDSGMLLYADGREAIGTLGFGDLDMYIAAYDPALNSSQCLEPITLSPTPYSVVALNPGMNWRQTNLLPSPMGGPNCQPIEYACIDYCEPYLCDPGWRSESKSCYQVQFIDTSLVSAPATYMWDINNDGTIDTMAQNFCYDFGCAGTFDVCLKVTDVYGIQKQICKTITVLPDATPPVRTGTMAPPDTTVMACVRGAIRKWTPPTFRDDCSPVTVTSTHQPGDFFKCGTTTVIYTGTNKDGLQTTYSFPVRVNCLCAATDSTSISCGIEPDQFDFYFKLNDLSGATSCTAANVTLPGLGNVNVSLNQWNSATRTLEVAGTIDATAYPFPTSFNLQVDYQCQCSDGDPYDCLHLVPFITPCCDSAYIDPVGICKVKEEVQVDIDFFGTVRDIDQVQYFVEPAPCPSTRWAGLPYQRSFGYQPLTLLPPYHSMDVCVYACVIVGGDERPCDTLYTEVVTLNLCSPYDCALNDQEYCFTGSPIIPGPISYNGPLPDCDFKIDWIDPSGNVIPLPAITTTYQPPALFYRGSPTECYQDYVYEMQLIGVCDTSSCFSTIRIWNDDAPKGIIELDPLENLPLCYGGDVTLAYRDSCVSPTDEWTWLESLDGVTYTPIVGAGTSNPLYNSNRLYVDHWYGVTKQNGVCAPDTTFFYVPVKGDLTITAFNADPLDPCRETGVKLSVQYTPCLPSINGVCNCNYTIDWYKNGLLIGTSNSTQPNAGFTYVDNSLNGNYSGIYYAVVRDNCCGNTKRSQVASVDPPVRLCITGPCYICTPGTQFTLMGIIKNGPAVGNNCTYQWYINNPSSGFQAIAGANSLSWTTTKPGLYLLEMICINGNTSCTQKVEFEVKDCTSNTTSIFKPDNARFDFSISPNPSTSDFQIEIEDNPGDDFEVQIYDAMGRRISVHQMPRGSKVLQLEQMISGIYLIRIVSKEYGAKTQQLVIQ